MADAQVAAAYMSFHSHDLDQNQITDYLTRVVQPKLSAIEGVQKAQIFGDRTFAMRVWLKPDKMARSASRRLKCRTLSRRTTTSPPSAGPRDDDLGQPRRQHQSGDRRRVQEAGGQRGQRTVVRLADVATSSSARRTTSRK